MSKNIIVIDIETTGLSPNSCEITEIGVLKVDAQTFEVVDQFSALIDIEGPVPFFITKLTGITRRMLDEQGIPLSVALNAVSEFCGDSVMYAHNSRFDKNFMRHYLEKAGINFTETKWIDTIDIFKKYMPGRKTYKLSSLIIDYGLATKEDHRAISDAMHTLELLKICQKKKQTM
ncbi:MAG: 3'-5' exonuclease [Mycoplasmataceae bacterium]|nr:3'-5' exonuclease [Mycoplasmataceae bacterium]